ncbi:hypothetical protein KQ41_06565 [Lysinibacillus fusiformis]|uniref:hypothetical protein n=1 Tax=Lysinibacillus fusiformis TaxID=28031 RepID=UPI000504F7C6|nr:hypothetical protein [Lysinibacillus fusiformis]KGA83698.1 hypothetical protein KQ41_06565 [Lysinibacillus fusiformis]
MKLKPNIITECYFTECVSGDISLNENDIYANMCPSDAEHLHIINVQGLFYPVFPQPLLKRKLVGYFISLEYNELIYIYENDKKYEIDESIGDLGWLPVKE